MTDKVRQQVDATDEAAVADARAENEAAVASADGGALQDADLERLERELSEARAQAAATHDKYLRAVADMENYKKRIERTYADLARTSKKELLGKLLAVKDNLERALQYGASSESGEGIMEGVRLTQYQLDSVLSQEGVREIEAEGKPFDPRLEEALQSVDDPNVPDHTVVQVVRKGYSYQDEVLRPAQVIVSVHGSERSDES